MIRVLTSLGLTSLGSASVVSCVAPQYATGENGQRVVVVTDGGQVNDHSFDQGTYEGMLSYLDEAYNYPDSLKKVIGYKNYVVPTNSTTTGLVAAYRLAKLKKADALVLPGFVHMGPLAQTTKLFENKTIILIDGSAPNLTDPLYKNVISILFNSQLAGMQAGFDTAVWATTKNDQGMLNGDTNGDGKITIGTFGGVNGKYAVDNYMWGLCLGIALFNQFYPDRPHVYLANAPEGEVANVRLTGNNDPAYYSGGFDLGGATKSGIIANLVDRKNADIIFPIAGSQIEDVLAYQPRKSKQPPYVIGVDVDQAAVYNTKANEGRFVTSAIKNIQAATKQALYHAASLKDLKDGELMTRTNTWDATPVEQLLNWSIDLTGPGYQLKTQHLKLYEGDGNQKVDSEKNLLIKMVNEAYENSGTLPQEYMDGIKITQLAKKIIQTSQTKNFELTTTK